MSMPKKVRSYRGILKAVRASPEAPMPLLLGGVLVHWSARFETRTQAEAWLAAVRCGQPCRTASEIRELSARPQILARETP